MKNEDVKVALFVSSILNIYRNEDEREFLDKLELSENTLTEDFTSMFRALHFIYNQITGDDGDLLDFINVVTRLSFQYVHENDLLEK